MKFTITREQLQEGLSAVAAAIPAKTTLPVLANALVEATKQGLRLSGTDLDIAVSTTAAGDRKSTRLNSSHLGISYAVFCLKKKKKKKNTTKTERQQMVIMKPR